MGKTSSAPLGGEPRRRRSLAAMLVPASVVVLVLLGLGTWQVQRLFWKLDLIDRVERRVHADPVSAAGPAQWRDIDAARDEYRRVTITGTLLNDRETLVKAVTDLGPGFWVMTPLRSDDGTVTLIDRGFVPPDRRDPDLRVEGQVSGPVTVRGLLRITEQGGGFLRGNDPVDGRWYSRDVAAIAAARHLGPVAPYFIDADASPNPGGFPVGGLTVVQFRNAHLIYALTWYGLAAMLVGMVVWIIRDERRRGSGTADPIDGPASGQRATGSS